MSKVISNNNSSDKRGLDDDEWIQEFYDFLTGENLPDSIRMSKTHRPKLTKKKAMAVIWYLQEHMRVLPDNIEQCWRCKSIFDSNREGLHWQSKGRNYCGACQYEVPENYDNNQRN